MYTEQSARHREDEMTKAGGLYRRGLLIADQLAALSGVLCMTKRVCRHAVTVLMYHRVLPDAKASDYPLTNLVVTLSYFRQQVDWLTKNCQMLTMAQAVANLVDNAVKYSDGAKQVTVTIERAGNEVVVHVQDRGIGISADEQEKIFERFHRVSTGLIHDVKGSGLGLSIVSHIVKAHRGTVTVKSEPGRGSTFTIRLPLAGSRARHPGQVFESRGESANPMGGT